LAGTVVIISIESVLIGAGILMGFGTAAITSLTALSRITIGIGIWTLVSVLISFFVGSYVTAVLARARFSEDGLWHGFIEWAFSTAIGILLGVSALLLAIILWGITINAIVSVTTATVSFTPSEIQAGANLVFRAAGFFLLGSLLSLVTSLLGGWAGSGRMSREEAYIEEENRRRRRTA
jgi:hypothetical protein